MMGDGFAGATAAGLFWTVNVCWAHPVISRASAVASSIFMVLFPMLFEVQNRMCKKIKQTLNNELKFHIVNICVYVRCDESSLYSRINYIHSPDGELLCGSVRE